MTVHDRSRERDNTPMLLVPSHYLGLSSSTCGDRMPHCLSVLSVCVSVCLCCLFVSRRVLFARLMSIPTGGPLAPNIACIEPVLRHPPTPSPRAHCFVARKVNPSARRRVRDKPKRTGAKLKEASVLSSFRERYTAVRRLALSSSTATTATDGKGNGGASKTVCVEVQFIGPQPSQGPGALLCNLLSGTSVEARPIELRRGRDNKRKRRDSGSDDGSEVEAEGCRDGKFATTDLFRRRKEFAEKVPLPIQDISSDNDDATYIKVSDELEPVPAPLTRPVYLTPLSLKGLAAFPSPPSTPLNEIPPTSPSSHLVRPSTPPREELPLLTIPRTLKPQEKALPLPAPRTVISRKEVLPLLMESRKEVLPSLTSQKKVLPSLTPQKEVLPPLAPREDVLPTSAPAVALPCTRMHWDDVICRIDAPPPRRGTLGRQHSLDLIEDLLDTSCSTVDLPPFSRGLLERHHSLDMGDVSSCSSSSSDCGGTDGEVFSSTGSGKEIDDDEQGTTTDRHHTGTGRCTPLHEPPLMFDIAEELLEHPAPLQQGPLSSWRPLSCARGVLRGMSVQCTDSVGMDSSYQNTFLQRPIETDPQKDAFAQGNSRDSSGLGCLAPEEVDGSADSARRVSPSTPVLVSCETAKRQPHVVVELVREFQECDFEGHHEAYASTTSAFSSSQYQLVIDGLESTGYSPENLVITAHFSVDSSHKVGRKASPIRVGANGQSHAALFFPSMQAIWPEVYSTNNVRTVEVDVTVDVRSRDDVFHHTTPNLKVIYRRASTSRTEEGSREGRL